MRRKSFSVLTAVWFVLLPLIVWAGGIHEHSPRGANQDAFHDTTQYDPGDLLMAAKAEIDTVDATYLSGDGSAITNVGAAASVAVTLEAKAAENITKGDAVYISGATGQLPQVSLCDNRDHAKASIIGLALETKTSGQNIDIRTFGELTGLNTLAWSDGDDLYLTVAGAYDNTEPTGGEVYHIGKVQYDHVSAGIIFVSVRTHPHYLASGAGEDIDLRMGDAAGLTAVSFKDSNDVEVATLNSDGAMEVTSLASSALSITSGTVYINGVTHTMLTELTDESETALHSHVGGGGGIASSDTTDSLLTNYWLKIAGDIVEVEQDVGREQFLDGGDNDYDVQALGVFQGRIYAGIRHGTYGTIWTFDADTSSIFSYFNNTDHEEAHCFLVHKGLLFIGNGDDTSDGDIDTFDGVSTWANVYDGAYDVVHDMETYGNCIYAAMGGLSGEGDILVSCDGGSTWDLSLDTIDYHVRNLAKWNGKLYCTTSQATTSGYAYLWEFDGVEWDAIGNPNTTHDCLALEGYQNYLYMGMGPGANEGDLYRWDGEAFEAPFINTTYESIYDLIVYNGRLLIGFGDSVDGGDLYVLDGEEFWKLWDNTYDYLESFAEYNNELYIGVGGSGNDNARVFQYRGGIVEGTPPLSPFEMDVTFLEKVTVLDTLVSDSALVVKNNILMTTSDGATSHGARLAIVFSPGETATESLSDVALIQAKDIGGTVEIIGQDEAGNVAAITRNIEFYPAAMELSDSRPYVTESHNIRTKAQTYIAEHRAFELLQLWAWENGNLPQNKFIILHKDVSAQVPMVQSQYLRDKKAREWDAGEESKLARSRLSLVRWMDRRRRIIAVSDSLLDAGIDFVFCPAIPDLKNAPAVYEKKPQPARITTSFLR